MNCSNKSKTLRSITNIFKIKLFCVKKPYSEIFQVLEQISEARSLKNKKLLPTIKILFDINSIPISQKTTLYSHSFQGRGGSRGHK